ncbi:unnamed protein product [Agarophyton chilense]
MGSLSSLRHEALQLYRDILRTARIFRGQTNDKMQNMESELRKSARREFEQNRTLISREDICRSLVVGRDALHQIQEKIAEKVTKNEPDDI